MVGPEKIAAIDIALLFGEAGDEARRQTVASIGSAARDIGFLTVTGTGILPEQVTEMRSVVARIFELDETEKRRRAITRDNYRGYIPLGFFTPNDGTGDADLYEGYKLHAETAADDPIRSQCALYGPNLWPPHVPEAQGVILGYWSAMDRAAEALLGALAESLGLAPVVWRDPFRQPLTNMTLLHYPPQQPDGTGFGIHPHKDTDALTIIAPDPVGGLEVRASSGRWIEVDCPAGGFVVNIGDMLELWSGGRLVSTPHRVVNRSGAERYSFPYFAVPRHDVTVAPVLEPLPGYCGEPVHCGRWSAKIWRTNWADETATEDTRSWARSLGEGRILLRSVDHGDCLEEKPCI